MNLISTPLRKRLSAENQGHCMRICKSPISLTENDYKVILSRWLEGAGTKSKSRRNQSSFMEQKKRTFSICTFIFICIRHVRGKKNEDIV